MNDTEDDIPDSAEPEERRREAVRLPESVIAGITEYANSDNLGFLHMGNSLFSIVLLARKEEDVNAIAVRAAHFILEGVIQGAFLEDTPNLVTLKKDIN